MTWLVPWLVAAAIGFVSGVLSGMFGIGGGIITTPAIRLLMAAPALVAVGTPLPVILPSALTGALSYRRRGLSDVRAGLVCGLAGALTATAGALATKFVGGTTVLIGTAVIIVWAAADMVLQSLMPPKQLAEIEAVEPAIAQIAAEESAVVTIEPVPPRTSQAPDGSRAPLGVLVAIGLVTGAYSGFFGLGGGFVLVPMLTRWLRFPIKRAIGTSLVGVAVLAIPGTITHALLGHIDWQIAMGLTIGVIPGAVLGARLNAGARDQTVRLSFAGLLVVTAAWLAISELLALK